MKRKIFAAALATLGLAAIPSGAQASLFIMTYTGTVASGTDQTNFFGLGTDLPSGASAPQFTLQFTVDTSVPAIFILDSTRQSLYGFGQNGSNPIVQSSFTLNGMTVSWSKSPDDGYNNGYGVSDRLDEYPAYLPVDRVYNYSEDYKDNENSIDSGIAYVESTANEIVNTNELTASLDYQVQGDDSQFGQFSSRRYSGASGYTRDVSVNLNITHVTVAPFSAAVPEPASWALMIAGFAAAGAGLRRRKLALTYR